MATNLRLHSLNDVKLVGRLTRDPDLRYTAQGTPVCHFRIAVGRRYKDRNSSEWKEEVAFVPCSVWRETAERVGQKLKKGSPVFVEGRLRSKEWQTKEGQKRVDMEVDVLRVQFLESMGDGAQEAEPVGEDSQQDTVAAAAPTARSASASYSKSSSETNDDEVPF